MWEGKPVDEKKDLANGELNQKSLEVATELIKDTSPIAHAVDDLKVAENGSATTTGDAPKGAKPVVAEKKIGVNGVANGC